MSTSRSELERRAALATRRRVEPEAAPIGQTAIRTKPVRVTLNMPPELYKQLMRWTGTAADALDVPRVSVQQALRAMIRGVTSEPELTAKIIHDVRVELGD